MVHRFVDAFTERAKQCGMTLAIATWQPVVGMRMRSLVAVDTADPLDSFTDHGIKKMLPGLGEQNDFSDAERPHLHRARINARIQALATSLKEVLP